MGRVIWTLAAFLGFLYLANAETAVESNILRRIVNPSNYDARVSPSKVSKRATDVYVNTYVRSIRKVCDRDMSMSVQLTFRMQWNDPRLKFNETALQESSKYLTTNDRNSIWKPDLFFSNELEARQHDVLVPNVLLRIHPNGDVQFSERISLKLSCPMNLKKFPHDDQTCSIIIASYAYTTSDLQLIWKKEDPVQVTKNMHLSRFWLMHFFTDYCTSKTNTGNYSCLRVDFNFERDFHYYLHRVYIPIIMLILVAYVAMWLQIEKYASARIGVIMGSLLLMSAGIYAFNIHNMVSYSRSIDCFTGYALTIVLAMLIESVIVARQTAKNGNSGNLEISESKANGKFIPNIDSIKRSFQTNKCSIDFWSRIFTPVAIAILILSYF